MQTITSEEFTKKVIEKMEDERNQIKSLEEDLAIEEGALSFHKGHVHSTKEHIDKCKKIIRSIKAKIKRLSK